MKFQLINWHQTIYFVLLLFVFLCTYVWTLECDYVHELQTLLDGSWHLIENLLFQNRKYLVVRAPVMLIPQKACSTRSFRFRRHMVATPSSKLNNLSTGLRSEWEKLLGLNLHIKSGRVYLESCEPFGLSDWLKYAARPGNELPLRRPNVAGCGAIYGRQ